MTTGLFSSLIKDAFHISYLKTEFYADILKCTLIYPLRLILTERVSVGKNGYGCFVQEALKTLGEHILFNDEIWSFWGVTRRHSKGDIPSLGWNP